MKEVLVDTDTLSYFLRNVPEVMAHADRYLRVHRGFTFSVITGFEIIRGLKVKAASRQLESFASIRSLSKLLHVTEPTVEIAADIYARLSVGGKRIGDADILIAATAIENGLALVTNNEGHFERIPGLELLNWSR